MTGVTEVLRVEQEFVTLDLLLFRRFAAEYPGFVEATFDANQGAADGGVFLPVGTRVAVTVPSPADPQSVRVVRLFD